MFVKLKKMLELKTAVNFTSNMIEKLEMRNTK